MLEEPNDDEYFVDKSKRALYCCRNLGELRAHGVLLSKGIKVKQKYLRNMLRMMKGVPLLGMRPTHRRRHANRSAKTVWHLGTVRKLIKCNFMVSVMIDGCSQNVASLKCLSINSAENTCSLFLKDTR